MTVKWIKSRVGDSVSAHLTPDLRISAYSYAPMQPRGSTEPPYRAFVFGLTLNARFATLEEARDAALAEAKKQIAQAAAALGMPLAQWQPINTAPRDSTFVLLAGPSGYNTTPLRVEVGRYYAEYRPLNPWQNHSNDAFTDGGEPPTLWMPLPEKSS